jgi:uncharacterized protein (DUF1697 family)
VTVYVALFRGINVGGRNKLPMAELRDVLADLGLRSVKAYIQSGNAVFESDDAAADIAERIETALPSRFKLDSSIIRVLILDGAQVRAVANEAPRGFGKEPDKYRYDVAFLLGVESAEVLDQIPVNPVVDKTWAGPGAIYYRRLIELVTKTHMTKIIGKPLYANMTIRNWNTTTKLAQMVDEVST